MVVRPITSNRTRSRQKGLPAIKDEASDWYQGWYFHLRIEEEVARSIRYHLPLSVLVFLLSEPAEERRDRRLLNELLSDMAARKLRRMDIPAVLGGDEYPVSLPHTNPKQAEVVARRLTKWFEPYRVAFGIASFPEDGQDPEQLLTLAEQRAQAAPTDAGTIAKSGHSARDRRTSYLANNNVAGSPGPMSEPAWLQQRA